MQFLRGAAGVLLLATAARAGEYSVFGPETFASQTGTASYSRQFSILDIDGQYGIRVRNGGANGELGRASSARISVDGRLVVGPADLNASVESVERLFSLPRNQGGIRHRRTLVLEVRGPAGSGISVSLFGVDNTPPSITASASPDANGNGWNNTPVTVRFTCTDATAGILTCPGPVTVTTEGADQVVSGTAVDRAGNEASASVTLKIDTTVPVVSASPAPAPSSEGWNNTDVTVSFSCQDVLSGVETCASPITVTDETAGREVEGSATDRAGNTASARATVKIDRTVPQVTISAPSDGATVDSSPVTVTGSFQDALSGVSTVTCNGAPATLSGGDFTCSVPVSPGNTTITVVARDRATNFGTARITVGLFAAPISVTITSPAALALFRTGPVTVDGTLDREATTVVVNGVPATLSGLQFTAAGVPLREGHNVLTATATGPGGSVGTGSVTVTMDSTPPTVRIDTPTEGAVVNAAQVTVSGMINDIVSGTVNGDQATVTVNGVVASISNRSFVAADVLLARGSNTLTAVARDRAGNESQTQVHLTFQDVAGQQRIEILGGNNQTGVIGSTLPESLLVGVVDAFGRAIPERAVTFTVVRTDGIVKGFPDEGRTVTVVTDDRGQARVQFQLGARTGAGNNQVAVTSTGFAGEVVFSATATVGPAVRIKADAVQGESFRGTAGSVVPTPFVVRVFDAGGNPVAGTPVTFSVAKGGGHFDNGQPTQARTTDSDGKAAVSYTLGAEAGINNNVVTAALDGSPGLPVTFTATALAAGPVAQTRVSGVIVDNTNKPIPNARATIFGTSLEAFTNDQGQFTIEGVPVGTIRLEVDGATSTRPETFPMLAFHITTVAGQDNTVGMPIYLPPLDTASSRIAGGDETVTLEMSGVPGVLFTIAPHSVTFKDGSRVGRVVLSQVHADKVPMPPPFGTAPRIVWTLQPPGARFDPPIRVQLPNTDALPPGRVIEVFQFDHDIEQFVSVGPARVSADGSVIVSDPGFGITKSGWGGAPPPPPPPTCVSSCDDSNPCTSDSCQDGACVHDPTNEGGRCDDLSGCSVGVCRGGACVRSSQEADGEACDDSNKCTEPDQCKSGSCEGEKVTNSECCKGEEFDQQTQCCVNDELLPKNPADLDKCTDRVPNPNWTFQYDGCSLQPLPAFFRNNPALCPGTQFSNDDFTGACDEHDRCYQTCIGNSSLSAGQEVCDQKLRNIAISTCLRPINLLPPSCLTRCLAFAEIYYRGLQLVGKGAYRERQTQVCNCCP